MSASIYSVKDMTLSDFSILTTIRNICEFITPLRRRWLLLTNGVLSASVLGIFAGISFRRTSSGPFHSSDLLESSPAVAVSYGVLLFGEKVNSICKRMRRVTKMKCTYSNFIQIWGNLREASLSEQVTKDDSKVVHPCSSLCHSSSLHFFSWSLPQGRTVIG